MVKAFIPTIDPVVSEARYAFAAQLLNIRGVGADIGEIAADAAFLADFVTGYLDDDDELEVEVTFDDGGDGDDTQGILI